MEAEAESSYTAIADGAADLLADVEDEWLEAQLVGLETACRWFAGDEVPFVELVRRCHQIDPELVPEEEFAAAQERLDEALPGDGSIHERFVSWREFGPEALIEKSLGLLDGAWPIYSFCYPAGYELAKRFVAGDPERFVRLLREPLTPNDVAA